MNVVIEEEASESTIAENIARERSGASQIADSIYDALSGAIRGFAPWLTKRASKAKLRNNIREVYNAVKSMKGMPTTIVYVNDEVLKNDLKKLSFSDDFIKKQIDFINKNKDLGGFSVGNKQFVIILPMSSIKSYTLGQIVRHEGTHNAIAQVTGKNHDKAINNLFGNIWKQDYVKKKFDSVYQLYLKKRGE